MEKKEVMFIFFISFIILSIYLSSAATTTIFQLDSKKYEMEIVSSSADSATIKVNNEEKAISPLKTSPPYNFAIFSASKPKLRLVLKRTIDNIFASAVFVIGVERNFSSLDSDASLTIDNSTYSISLVSIDTESIVIKVNNEDTTVSSVQSYSSSTPSDSVLGLRFVLTDVFINETENETTEATLLMVFEKNLTQQCSESWTCSAWTECISGFKTRTCTDKNTCEAEEGKPSERQRCVMPNCTNECETLDEKSCNNETTYKICSNFNSDSCLEYGNITLCEAGKKCNNGQCITNQTSENTQNKSNSKNKMLIILSITGLIILIALIIGFFPKIRVYITKHKFL